MPLLNDVDCPFKELGDSVTEQLQYAGTTAAVPLPGPMQEATAFPDEHTSPTVGQPARGPAFEKSRNTIISIRKHSPLSAAVRIATPEATNTRATPGLPRRAPAIFAC